MAKFAPLACFAFRHFRLSRPLPLMTIPNNVIFLDDSLLSFSPSVPDMVSNIENYGDFRQVVELMDDETSSSSSGLPGPSPKKTIVPASIQTLDNPPPTSHSSQPNPKRSSRRSSTNDHHHCYLLRSLHIDHPLKTYIGYTTHPSRRIRQHNGNIQGGARRTRRAGRPWTFSCIVSGSGFDRVSALQFEWAWQNVGRSKAFREGVGDDKVAKKMGRRLGVKSRLEELRVLLVECRPWSELEFVVYFMEEEMQDLFLALVRSAQGRAGGEKGRIVTTRVCRLEDMPFHAEIQARKKKGSRRTTAEECSVSSLDDIVEVPLEEIAQREWSVGNWQDIADEPGREEMDLSSFRLTRDGVENLDFQGLSIDLESDSSLELLGEDTSSAVVLVSNYYDLCDSA